MTGEFDGPKIEVELFGEKMEIEFTVLDTDYDNYMIGYECFDNMKFALESEESIEPVHMITFGIVSRDPNCDQAELDKLVDKALEFLPFMSKEDIVSIE